MSSGSDPVVLSYENSLLRQSDVQLLEAPNWLNDNIIAFWFEYLENSMYKDWKNLFGFVCPQTVQHFKYASLEDVKATIDGLNLHQKQYVFFPVNDSRGKITPGGTHWSLLVYNARSNNFEHYDSLPTSYNLSVAESLAKTLAVFLRDSSKFTSQSIVQEMACTYQSNSYDCGMHVICNTEGLCRKFIGNDPRPLTEIVPSSYVAGSRETLKKLIYSLRK